MPEVNNFIFVMAAKYKVNKLFRLASVCKTWHTTIDQLVCEGPFTGYPLKLEVVSGHEKLSNEMIKRFKNITDLKLCVYGNLDTEDSDEDSEELMNLAHLQDLDEVSQDEITDQEGTSLINLPDVNLIHIKTITDDGISSLINLKKLNLAGNITITDVGIRKLTNLKTLVLDNNINITNDALTVLTNLKKIIR